MIILFCDNLKKQSGWGRYSRDILEIIKHRKDVIVICHKKNKKLNFLQYNLLRNPIEYLKNPFLIFIDVKKIKVLLSKFYLENNIAHFTVEPYILFLPFLKNFFNKNIFTAHGSYSLILYKSFRVSILFKISIKYLNLVIYVSKYTKRKLKEIFTNPVIKTRVIINSIYFKKFLNQTRKKNYFISIGSVKPRKGHHHLIPVIKDLIKKNYNNFLFEIIGSIDDKIYYQYLKKRVAEEKLGKFLKFKGFLSDKKLRSKMKYSKLLILLSDDIGDKFEGFGLVYLEALYYKLHVIISKNSGANCLRIPYESGIISEPKNYKKISKYVEDIINSNIKIDYKNNQNFLIKSFDIYRRQIKSLYKN
jgi:glycosyltransferase involved in cell wall biosynthesis